jgi:hypothetical protein
MTWAKAASNFGKSILRIRAQFSTAFKGKEHFPFNIAALVLLVLGGRDVVVSLVVVL